MNHFDNAVQFLQITLKMLVVFLFGNIEIESVCFTVFTIKIISKHVQNHKIRT